MTVAKKMPNLRWLLLASVVSVSIAALVAGAGSMFAGSSKLHLVAIGCLCYLAFTGPIVLLRRRISPFDPILLIALYVFIGCTLASAFLAYGSGPRHAIVIKGETVEFFVLGGYITLFGLLLTGSANGLVRGRFPVERLLTIRQVSGRRLTAALAFFSIASTFATVRYLQLTGGLSFDRLSAKRSILIDVRGIEEVHGAAAYVAKFAELSFTVGLIALAAILMRRVRVGVVAIMFLVVALAVPMASNFFSSSRASVLLSLIMVGLVVSLHRGFSARWWLGAAAAGLTVFSVMTGLRSAAHGADDAQSVHSVAAAFVSLGESGNGLSLVGTSHIVQHVPERLDYLLGRSYLTWVTAPIPRSIWPEKPDVSLGKTVKEEILQQGVVRTGRPPSFLSEGYMNFGIVGLVMSAIAFGALSRIISNTFFPILTTSPYGPALFFGLALGLIKVTNGNFSQAMVSILFHLGSFALIVFFIGGRGNRPSDAIVYQRT